MLRALRSRSGVTFLLLVFVLVAALLHQGGQLGPVEDLILTLFSPLQYALRDLSRGATGALGNFEDSGALRAQVDTLTDEVNRLTIDQVRLRELEIENTQLREQLGYLQGNPDFGLVGSTVLEQKADAASVVGQEPSGLGSYILIDQGRENGVAVGMPVVTPAGLVGRVIELGGRWSKVMLLIDPTSSVNVVIQSSRATGVLQGQVGGEIVIKYLPQGEIVKNGDLVLTSGIGGTFPKRLVVGQVVEVRHRDIDLFQEAVVKPSVDFNRLEFVLIIKNFTPQDITQEPTPTPTARPTNTPTPAATPTVRR